ncbi:unnamed protein product, partial [Timema podura]|nr:unnamed protein product [Timema podura]
MVPAATLTSTATERELGVSVSVSSHSELSAQCRASASASVPKCRVVVELLPSIPLSNLQVSIIVEPPLAAAKTSCTISSLCEKSQVVTYVYLRDVRCDVATLQVRVVTSYMTSIGGFPRVLQITAQLPLALVASVCALVKEADFKITLNINQPPATLAQLFP